ncbi:toxin [Thermobifida alba]|uniref:UDP-N-acetylglucosamine kinase n=1 Tax=Thermobifida alba TaxID=53522 RepID=A0ABY4LA36_THEAE|nr:zeta toxin family protein [Thermobifida alba]UPT22982.1 toxin [Thermobifida alba]
MSTVALGDEGIRKPFVDGGTPRLASQERHHRNELERLLKTILGRHRSLWSRAATPAERRELLTQARPYQDELKDLVFLSPEDQQRILRDYPAVADSLVAEGRAPVSEVREPSDAELAEIFADHYRAKVTGEPRTTPRVFLFGGQQGSGKTEMQKDALRVLGRGAVSYDGDDNAEFHPDYEDLMRADDVNVQPLLAELTSPLHDMVLDHVTAHRYDTVASHPLQRLEWARLWVDRFRDAGYHVSVVYLAVHESTSLLATVDRFQTDWRERYGFGRWVEPESHDASYRLVPDTAHTLEAEGYVDSMRVISRDGRVLYENHLGPDGRMRDALGARRAIETERNRRRTSQEIADFAARLRRLRRTAPSWAQPVLVDAERRHRAVAA